MIIAVGYRVNSKRGTAFRQWANKILKQYMLKGYAIEPSRVLVSKENYLDLVNVVNRIDCTQTDLIGRVERLEDKYPDLGQKIFFTGAPTARGPPPLGRTRPPPPLRSIYSDFTPFGETSSAYFVAVTVRAIPVQSC